VRKLRASADPPDPLERTTAVTRRGGESKNSAVLGFDVLDAIAVYDGRTLLGYVHENGDRWVAFGHDERRIGSFATRKLATQAVMEAHASPMNGGGDV
jgi:hypothetical protein